MNESEDRGKGARFQAWLGLITFLILFGLLAGGAILALIRVASWIWKWLGLGAGHNLLPWIS